ncbi:MAG: NADH-quinone oxidoreductase subunit A [Planctomycetaceae bacterium]|nr:NADH-quinone oxidoreductase subunit A [Planctomycetaceae bacterium]
MLDLVGHLQLFVVLGIVFLLLPLVIGLLVRPTLPTSQKLAAYECGEPTIGSSYVQFDLRFYVVALLFIIFDVEVAFFFPWAAVFGGGTQLLDGRLTDAARMQLSERLLNHAPGTLAPENVISAAAANGLVLTGLVDILVFFAVLLVAFAYVWKRGDLDWVRAMTETLKPRSVTSVVTRTVPTLPVGTDRKLEPVA